MSSNEMRELMRARVLTSRSAEAQRCLAGDEDALLNLLVAAAALDWHRRVEVVGSPESVAAEAGAFADELPPSTSSDRRLTSLGDEDDLRTRALRVSDRVHALAMEVQAHRGAMAPGADSSQVAQDSTIAMQLVRQLAAAISSAWDDQRPPSYGSVVAAAEVATVLARLHSRVQAAVGLWLQIEQSATALPPRPRLVGAPSAQRPTLNVWSAVQLVHAEVPHLRLLEMLLDAVASVTPLSTLTVRDLYFFTDAELNVRMNRLY